MMNSKLLADKVNYYAFVLFILVSPINLQLQIYCFDFWLLTHLISLSVNGLKKIELKKHWSFICLVVLFLLYCVSLFYSENMVFGRKQMETKLGLFVIPFIFFTRVNPNYDLKKTLFFICTGFLLSIIFITGKSIFDIFNYNEIRVIYNSSPFKLLQAEVNMITHRLYWGMFGLFAFLSAIYLYIRSAKGRKILIFLLSYLLIISFFLVIIESRIIWILLIVISLMMVKYIPDKKFKIIAVLFIVFGIIIISYLAVPRFIQFFNFSETKTENLQYAEPRLFIWVTSWQAITDSWAFGYGAGDAMDILTQKFIENKNTFAANQKFIAHNQFLQTWLEVGLGGVILLFLFIGSGIFQIRKLKNNFLIIGFYLVLLFSLTVESILNRFQGVILFSLVPFLSYFIIRENEHPEAENSKIEFNIKIKRIGITLICILIISIFLLIIFKPLKDYRKPESFLTKPFREYPISINDSLNIPEGTKGIEYKYDVIKDFLSSRNEFYDVIYTTENFLADTIYASVYCKTSEDFKGLVCLYIGSSGTGYKISDYKFTKAQAGKWQKLSTQKPLGSGIENVILFIKTGDSAFKGEVYFVYPEIKEK